MDLPDKSNLLSTCLFLGCLVHLVLVSALSTVRTLLKCLYLVITVSVRGDVVKLKVISLEVDDNIASVRDVSAVT